MRVAWYNIMTAVQDPKTQIYGTKAIMFSVAADNSPSTSSKERDIPSFLQLPKVMDATPLYWNGLHICVQQLAEPTVGGGVLGGGIIKRTFSKALFASSDAFTRMKIRAHYGTRYFLFCH